MPLLLCTAPGQAKRKTPAVLLVIIPRHPPLLSSGDIPTIFFLSGIRGLLDRAVLGCNTCLGLLRGSKCGGPGRIRVNDGFELRRQCKPNSDDREAIGSSVCDLCEYGNLSHISVSDMGNLLHTTVVS